MDSTLISIGSMIGMLAQAIDLARPVVFGGMILAVVVVILFHVIADSLKLNPFSKYTYYSTKPANQLIGKMRQSRFFYPLKRAFGFDPSILMILLSTAILGYVIYTMIGYFNIFLAGLANSFLSAGRGNALIGGKYLIGAVLIAAIFFLLSLMLIVFVNSLFGLLRNMVGYAFRRINPLLQLFEFGGIFAGWSFLILWIALTFAAEAVIAIFL